MSPEIFFTPDEIAYRMRCTPEYIRAEIRRGKIKNVIISGRKYLIPEKSYHQYLEQRTVNHHG